jgi:hypothetical protein
MAAPMVAGAAALLLAANPQADAAALVDQVEKLLTPSETGEAFARRYYEALQRQPAVVLAHADVRRALKTMREARPGGPPML